MPIELKDLLELYIRLVMQQKYPGLVSHGPGRRIGVTSGGVAGGYMTSIVIDKAELRERFFGHAGKGLELLQYIGAKVNVAVHEANILANEKGVGDFRLWWGDIEDMASQGLDQFWCLGIFMYPAEVVE